MNFNGLQIPQGAGLLVRLRGCSRDLSVDRILTGVVWAVENEKLIYSRVC
jgi:hypothetical protein